MFRRFFERLNDQRTMTLLLVFGVLALFDFKTEAAVMVNSSDFKQVVQTTGFVDKTKLIKEILMAKKRMSLVTAPRRFGKSTNLNMIKEFLTIRVDARTGVMYPNSSSVADAIFNQTAIYKMQDFYQRYCGQYPIVHLDLQVNEPVLNVTDMLLILRQKVHHCYLEHSYLLHSLKLSPQDKLFINGWLNPKRYSYVNERVITHGVTTLIFYLYRQFYKMPVMLIDAYDDILLRSMLKVGTAVMTEIATTTASVVSVIASAKQLAHLYVTGVSSLASLSVSTLPRLEVYQFLRNHSLAKYFGFREKEVGIVFGRFDVNYVMVKQVENKYRGYESESGMIVYNPVSILRFVDKQDVAPAWTDTESIENIAFILNNTNIMQQLVYICSFKFIRASLASHSSVEFLNEWRKIFVRDNIHIDFDVLYSVLYEYGYLTFSPMESRSYTSWLRIPNIEIAEYFFKELLQTFQSTQKDYLDQIFNNITVLVQNPEKIL